MNEALPKVAKLAAILSMSDWRDALCQLCDEHLHNHHTAICHGKPCICGLRYPVESVLEWLAAGMTAEEILAEYEEFE